MTAPITEKVLFDKWIDLLNDGISWLRIGEDLILDPEVKLYCWKERVKRTVVNFERPPDDETLEPMRVRSYLEGFEDTQEMKELGFKEVSREEVEVLQVRHIKVTSDSFYEGPFDWPLTIGKFDKEVL